MLFINSLRFVGGQNIGFALALQLCIFAANAADSDIIYQIVLSASNQQLLGSVCQNEITSKAFDLPENARWVSSEPFVDTASGSSCIHYRKTLSSNKSTRYFDAAQHRGVTVSSLDAVLPCAKSTKRYRGRIQITLDKGAQASLPGKRVATNEFELLDRPCGWSSVLVYGEIIERTLNFGESKIRIAMPTALSNEHQQKLMSWLNSGLNALALAYGSLPLPETQLLIFPVGKNREAVPWGQAMRGGGDAVHLYVDETKSLLELNDDWVLVHELSHLLHPYMMGADGWLSEGIASYYQNVLRARSGLLTNIQAWEKLDAGFQRGEKQFTPGVRLYENTRNLMRQRQYMRVYWSGAAIALIGDVKLRQASGGNMTLDKLLKEIAACCLPTTRRRWQAKDLILRFDEISGTQIFSQLYNDYVMHAEFPTLSDIYEDLGVQRTNSGLRFNTGGEGLRDSIMN